LTCRANCHDMNDCRCSPTTGALRSVVLVSTWSIGELVTRGGIGRLKDCTRKPLAEHMFATNMVDVRGDRGPKVRSIACQMMRSSEAGRPSSWTMRPAVVEQTMNDHIRRWRRCRAIELCHLDNVGSFVAGTDSAYRLSRGCLGREWGFLGSRFFLVKANLRSHRFVGALEPASRCRCKNRDQWPGINFSGVEAFGEMDATSSCHGKRKYCLSRCLQVHGRVDDPPPSAASSRVRHGQE
jgi:hypothetical protein